jgi:peptidyl-prolyl cis-trans isomerase B (cyclophilin B)
MRRVRFLLFSLILISCQLKAQKQDTIYISTSLGTMKAVFYDDVPRHRAMYTERISYGAFDGTLFFRVVPDFIIQGGAPDSRNAAPGERVGQGSNQFLLKPEFCSAHFARKGAIAAPRQPDNMNPQKESDCSQFFIVKGKVYTQGYLDSLEMQRNNPLKNAWWAANYTPHKAEMDSLRKADPRQFNQRLRAFRAEMDSALRNNPKALFFSEEQRKILTTQGGELSLDMQYTFFAQVVEGLEVIDKITALKTDAYERPLRDVVIHSVRIR